MVIGRVGHQTDTVGQQIVVNAYASGREACAYKFAFVLFTDGFYAEIVSGVGT